MDAKHTCVFLYKVTLSLREQRLDKSESCVSSDKMRFSAFFSSAYDKYEILVDLNF